VFDRSNKSCIIKIYTTKEKWDEIPMYCVSCGAELQKGVCPKCGKSDSSLEILSMEREEQVICINCDKEVRYDHEYCYYCGDELIGYKPDKEERERREADRRANAMRNVSAKKGSPDGTKWLILGILTLPFSITSLGSIICGISAINKKKSGNTSGAVKSTRAAKRWFFAGVIIYAFAAAWMLLSGILDML